MTLALFSHAAMYRLLYVLLSTESFSRCADRYTGTANEFTT